MSEDQRNVSSYRTVSGKHNTYNREKLYKEVWEKPVIEVAAQYGVSDVAIHKVCKSLNIPAPPRGYWARLRAGEKMEQPPLSPTNGITEKTGSRSYEGNKIIDSSPQLLEFLTDSEREKILNAAQQIQISDESTQLHKKILTYKSVIKEWDKNDPRPKGSQKSFRNYTNAPPFLAGVISGDALPRVFRILDALFKTVESLGGIINDDLSLQIRNEYVTLAECIENMRISTIHSLCKKILEHYAVKLALGKNLSIVSGKYEKDAMISQAVNDYIESNCTSGDPSKLFNMPMYEMQSRLSDLMTKFQNKNVDIVNDDLNFGNFISSKQIHDAIKTIPMVAEKQIRKYFDDLSSVRLSDLMIKLKELVTCFGQELSEENYPIKYLFVDEFQDTDDVQINLMKKFRDVFGFNFFVVGDVKQCIYRFRGADEKAFDTLAPIKDKWELYSLNKNYRTDKNLLTAFDKRFSSWGKHKLLDYKENDVLVGVKDYRNTSAETSY